MGEVIPLLLLRVMKAVVEGVALAEMGDLLIPMEAQEEEAVAVLVEMAGMSIFQPSIQEEAAVVVVEGLDPALAQEQI